MKLRPGGLFGGRERGLALFSRCPANDDVPGSEESLTPSAAPAVDAMAEDTRA